MTREDYISWMNSPCTKFLLSEINEAKEGLKENWANGGYREQLKDAEAVGMSRALNEILDVIEDMKEKTDETGD